MTWHRRASSAIFYGMCVAAFGLAVVIYLRGR